MRSSRFNKFKQKNRSFLLFLKTSVIWYILIFLIGYLTSDTAAQFTAYQESSGEVTVGKWESPDEESILRFITKGNKNIQACESVIIATELKNDGPGDLKENGSFELYYIENGNPEKHGEKLALSEDEGIIKPIKKGETAPLTYEASKPGVYVFSTKENPGDSDSKTIWSKWTIVNCPSSNNIDEKQNNKNTNSVPSEAEESEIQEKETEGSSEEQVESKDINESTETKMDEKGSVEENTTEMDEKENVENNKTEMKEKEEEIEAPVESVEPIIAEEENEKEANMTNEQDGGEE
ncbi:amyloid fiber anchoring/assembly protein TapA [Oceanobacillus longus]|uniref:Amyloid fiber anchoring/assembly protein TapA n=1 Tax=Oceanobacillus longus TaxID=930120 RepID=A0ABV8GVN8_9BACI